MSTLNSLLTELTSVEGVTTAVVVGRDGFVIDGVGKGSIELDVVGSIIASGIGSSEAMGRELGIGALGQGMLEFEEGVIMTSLLGEDAVLAVVAMARSNLGMVRFQLKKRAPEVVQALGVPA